MSRRLLVALAVAGLVLLALAAAVVRLAHDFEPADPGEGGGLIVYAGIWIATGLVALHRRPENRVGLLMTALGFAVASGQLYWDASLPYMAFGALAALELPITVHLFLAFPSGRLETSLERRLVAGGYCAWLVLVPVDSLLRDPPRDDCPQCPSNPFRVVGSDAVAAAFQAAVGILIVGVFVVTAVLLVRKVRAARGATRRALGPVLLTSAFAILLFVPYVIVDAAGGQVDDPPLSWAGGAFMLIPIAFVVGLLRTRLQRSGVADLVVELRSLSRPDDVRDAIARALGDPSLELAFWLPADERYVDPRGEPLDLTAREGRAVTVLEHDGRRVAALVHDPALLDEPELLEAVGAAASLALENARLQAELSAQLAEVRASRARIVEAGDAERRRLERDLHDGAQQRLLGIRLALQLARGRLGDERGLEELLTEADAEVVGALDELRTLARGIHPPILTDEGLAPAIAALARRAPVPIELTISPERLPEPVEATAYFVASEALANVAKHARASRATIAVARTNGRVAIEVTDDGVGGADAEGTGLRGLRDRVEALDGRLDVETRVGAGTRVTAVIPCA
jgi:signal transduction histidine kinase